MKKLVMTVCLVVAMLLIVPAKSRAVDSSYISIGGGQESFSLELGKSVDNQLFGFGLTYIDYKKYHSSIGHITYQETFFRVEEGPACGIYGKYGLELIENSGLFLTGFGGITYSKESIQYEFYHEDDYICKDKNSDYSIAALYGAGLTYFMPDHPIVISVDYDNVRELTGSVGYCWKY